MNIIDKRPDTKIIEDDGVRCFLLEGKDKAALIDTGMHIEDIRKLITSLTDKEIVLINTHADRDHINGNDLFDEVHIGVHELAFYQKADHDHKIVPLYEGDLIELGDRTLEVIDLPGHTPGSIALLDRKYKTLISGDPIQRNGNVFMFGEQRNLCAYVSSLQRLEKRKDEFAEIWPSHADLPLHADSIMKCCRDVEDIIEGKLGYELVDKFGNTIRAYKGKENIYLADNK